MTQSKYTNKADFFGSLMFNVNYMTGFLLGDPTAIQMQLHSDTCFHDSKQVNYISLVEDTVDYGDAPGMGALVESDTHYMSALTDEEWAQGDWFLFGRTFLPWFAPPKGTNGGYVRRHDINYVTAFNKASFPVLIPTLVTAAKVGAAVTAVGTASWYGYKYATKN